jgi:cathepsin B
MKVVILGLLLVSAFALEYAVTQDYIDYLKKHVTWEVANYEDNIFRGWSVDEVRSILNQNELDDSEIQPIMKVDISGLPSSLDWRLKSATCIHEIRNQGNCGSCWAFSASSVVSDRCCLRKEDHGWLSPQELVSCDKANGGCNGGWEFNALDYVAKYGLVPDACFPYKAANLPCPSKCADGKDWTSSHICKCGAKVFCQGSDAMVKCMQTGPVTAGMWVYPDFMNYRGGIYKWNKQGGRLGGHAIRCIGYAASPEAHYTCANSWGTSWGEQGYFRIAVGEVGIDSRNPSYCDPL